jgi:peptidoglycan/xylan/chitin deacetylase (PgdA/CDA1 family)
MKSLKIWVPLLALACNGWVACTHAHGRDDVPVTKPAARPGKFDWQPLAYDSAKQYIYLSFDDGPQHGTTTCFDLVRREHIKASFFMVGLHTARKTDGRKIVAMIRNAYPEVLLANHSYTHAMGRYPYFYHHAAAAEQDFLRAQDSLKVPFKISRLPGNNAWAEQGNIRASHLAQPVTRLLDSAGYNVIGWDLEWRFKKTSARPVQSATKLAAQVDSLLAMNKTHTPHHLVILSHDRMFQRPEDADSLARFITLLKHNPRYVFETVDHYPGVKFK